MSSAATSLLGQKRSCDTTRDEDRRIARRADLDGSPRSSRAGSVVSSRDYSEETRRTDARSTQRDEDGRHRSHREDRDARRDRDATRPREQGRSDRDRTKDRERDRARDTDRDRERHGSHHSSRRREEPSRSSSSLHDRDDRER